MSDAAEGKPTTGATPLDADERAELERLRQEVAASRPAVASRRWSVPWRRPVSAFLIVVGCVLAPVTVTAEWAHTQLADTEQFVATVGPVVRDPSVRAALTDRITDTVFRYVDVRGLADQAVDALGHTGLPPMVVGRLRGFTGPLTDAVHGFVHREVAALVASAPFAETWDSAIGIVHDQMIGALSGNGSALTISNGQVLLDIGPFITAAKQQLVAAGFTLANVIPEIHPTIAVTNARTLTRARTAYRLLDALATWLPWITLLFLAVGCALARGRRRAILACGAGVAVSMVVLAGALLVVRGVLVGGVPDRSVAATAASYDIVVRFLRDSLRAVLVLGVVVALGALLTGPSAAAVRIRRNVRAGLAWLRRRGARAGWRGSRIGAWVHTYRVALRVAVLGVAVGVLAFLDQPSVLTVLVIAVLLVFCLGVIQFLDLPPSNG